jgi:N-acetylmuramic acid 6-phosphate etherase
MNRITESDSKYRHLDQKTSRELLDIINTEDQTVPMAVASCMDQVEVLVEVIHERMSNGGRLFYIGAGTSGRLGILDASECPPTFGVPHEWVVGLIAGGDAAIRKAVEHAEDSREAAWQDLQQHEVTVEDVVVGIAASGTTPYVIGGVEAARSAGLSTGCITCNPDSPLASAATYPISCVVGPEVVTGSTRMKAGTAQKLILNMITTTVMIRLGRVVDNKMVDMQLSNDKLIDRGTRLIMQQSDLDYSAAQALLLETGSVRKALEAV